MKLPDDHPGDYSDPPVPEGINVQHDHPLLDFGGLVLAVALATVALVLVVVLSASWLSRYIPFAYEQEIAEAVFSTGPGKEFLQGENASQLQQEKQQKIETYLNTLAERIALAQDFPPDMRVTVHFVEGETVNAFATLGGHIVLYSGLTNKLQSENALVMLLAHEMAHVRHRDPVVALGRGFTLMLALSAFAGAGSSSGAVQSMVGDIGLMTTLGFSRQQERDADQLALDTILAMYGHTAGAAQLFVVLREEGSKKGEPPVFMSTHPDTEERYELLQQAATGSDEGVTPLPEWM